MLHPPTRSDDELEGVFAAFLTDHAGQCQSLEITLAYEGLDVTLCEGQTPIKLRVEHRRRSPDCGRDLEICLQSSNTNRFHVGDFEFRNVRVIHAVRMLEADHALKGEPTKAVCVETQTCRVKPWCIGRISRRCSQCGTGHQLPWLRIRNGGGGSAISNRARLRFPDNLSYPHAVGSG